MGIKNHKLCGGNGIRDITFTKSAVTHYKKKKTGIE